MEYRAAETAPKRNADHVLQFYDDDEFLACAVADWLGDGLKASEGVVVIATSAHREVFAAQLRQQGFDFDAACVKGQATLLDALETLSAVTVGGAVDWSLFHSVVGGAIDGIARAAQRGRVRAYGEMVDLLWRDGKSDLALQMEEFWNRLGCDRPLSVLCGYSVESLKQTEPEPFKRIREAHGAVAAQRKP